MALLKRITNKFSYFDVVCDESSLLRIDAGNGFCKKCWERCLDWKRYHISAPLHWPSFIWCIKHFNSSVFSNMLRSFSSRECCLILLCQKSDLWVNYGVDGILYFSFFPNGLNKSLWFSFWRFPFSRFPFFFENKENIRKFSYLLNVSFSL